MAADLLKVFDSQVTGGMRYDLAAIGRRAAHATFHTSHATDRCQGITWAMELTPLVANPELNVADYVREYVFRLEHDVRSRLARFTSLPTGPA